MKRRGGFTLIELSVALAIVVVASGILILRFTGWSSKQSLRSSSRALGNVIRVWRERAKTGETSYTLTVDESRYQVAAGGEILRRGRFGEGETVEGGPLSLVFAPRGILPETRLTLRNAAGERVMLLLGSLINEIDYEEPR